MNRSVFNVSILSASFLAAFLSFSIQPMAGRTILPLVGGAPQGWLISLAFFQMALTVGYGIVYLTRHMNPRLAAGVVAAALGLSAFLVHTGSMQSTLMTSWSLFGFLWMWLGIPCIALGTIAPLVQRMFFSAKMDNPYWLYAISNAGSLLGLLAYPLLIEPFTGLQVQSMTWRAGLVVLAFIVVISVLATPRQQTVDTTPETGQAPGWRQVVTWMGFAMIPTSLLSGSTLLISTDIGSFPLLWVIPLALYLCTYIAAFSGIGQSRWLPYLQILLSAVILTKIIAGITLSALTGWPYAALILVTFTVTALLCHARLYKARPQAGQLPLFYLALALGGALGGSFNAFIAPLLFSNAIEFYIVLAIALTALAPRPAKSRKMVYAAVVGACIGFATISLYEMTTYYDPMLKYFIVVAGTVGILLSFLRIRVFAVLVFVCLILYSGLPVRFAPTPEHRIRNFFGITRVMDAPNMLTRMMVHGTTVHGMQPLDLWAEKMPITYYAETGPAGDVMKLVTSGRMAVIGLGAGQMACYTTKDRPIDYYELDPDVLKLAEAHFTYLAKCPPQAMHIGDARLSLMQDGPKYRVIVLDAFSSDSIPTHLLTREAIQVYLNRLEPGGYLLFHISNNFFALDGPLAETAKSLGLWSLYKYGPELLTNDYDLASNWLIMGGDRQVETALRAQGWHEADSYPNPWTDDYAPVMSVIRFLKPPNR